MIENKYENEVDAVWEAIGAFHKGTTVPWSLVESAMGRHRDDLGGWTIVRRVRRRLLRDRHITSLADPTVGIRLLTDMQAASEIPKLRQKKAKRQISRGLRETDAVDTAQLTRHAAVSLAIARRHMKAERLAISRSTRELESLTRPTRSVLGK